MRATQLILSAAALTSVHATNITATTSLEDACTVANVEAALPASVLYNGTTLIAGTVTAAPVYNASATANVFFPDAVFDYCNVTFAYTHTGMNDTVLVAYWLPAPAAYQSRFLATGGGGYAINSGLTNTGSLPGAIMYGAVGGLTDGGFGGFSNNLDSVTPIANGTANDQAVLMFGYLGIHEMTVMGKAFAAQFYGSGTSKIFSYYQGCSEGGRDGWSQVQRFADQFDGAVTGAPAFRFAQQQTQHLWSNVVEQDVGYFPSPCEFEAITNATLLACDGLDGLVDGVVSRSDLCQLNFNLNSTIGTPYACAATEAFAAPFPGGPASAAVPAQSGNITAEAVTVANMINAGIVDDEGKQVYFSYQLAAVSYGDAATSLNTDTNTWELAINTMGSEYITRFIELLDTDDFENLDNVTGSTLKEWIVQGMAEYADTLQTTNPDLTAFQAAGGKVLHFHGESDNSIPTASSVRYYESVRSVMYPNSTFNESTAALSDWYQLYLVPGAAHCSINSLEANGPFPQTNLQVMIDWVEQGIAPVTLNATHLAGDNVGANAQICAWPLRPLWSDGSTTPECVYDQASIDTFMYDLDAYNVTVF